MTKEEREAFIKWAVDDHEGWFIAWVCLGICALIAAGTLMLCSLWLIAGLVIAGGVFWPFVLVAVNQTLLAVRRVLSPKMRRQRKELSETAKHAAKVRKAEEAARRHDELERYCNI